eukprot:224794_1
MSTKLQNWCESHELDYSKFVAKNLSLEDIANTKGAQISVLAEELGLSSRQRGQLMDGIKTLQNMDKEDEDENVGLYDDPEVIVKGNDSGDYNEFEGNDDDDAEENKSIHEESFMLRSNFSDDPADQWDIVQFFDKNEKFAKFKPILLLQMQIQNSANYNGNDGMGGNQNDQLDHLLDTMLGSGNQNDSSSDSDEEVYMTQPDAHTFGEYIRMGHMPSPNSLIYDVVLNEYELNEYDDIRKEEEEAKEPFTSTIHYAQALDFRMSEPSDTKEHFMSIQLNSCIKNEDYKRYKSNVVVVLETSLSMNDAYHKSADTKQNVANSIVCAILDELRADDKFCLVTFNDTFNIEQPLDEVGSIGMDEIKSATLAIECSGGGCDWDEGYNAALGQLQELFDAQIMAAAANQSDEDEECENRIILLTNSLPNSDSSLIDLMQVYSDSDENKVYTSFVAIGDAPSAKLVNAVHKLRGCSIRNYLFDTKESVVNNIKTSFNALINPVFFNVSLVLKACKTDTVYGYHNNMKKIGKLNATGTVQHRKTWFASQDEEEEMVTMRLQSPGDDEIAFEVCVEYEDRSGEMGSSTRKVVLTRDKEKGMVDEKDDTYYDNEAIRKRIVLIKYVELMNEWLARDSNSGDTNLNVSDGFKKEFAMFATYFERQIDAINDDKLKQEIEILNILMNFDPAKAEQWRKSNET